MKDSLGQLLKSIQAARKQKGLSQRALSAKVGLAQSHLSKIESGMLDFQISNLIQLSRALDLEPMLIPRSLVPAVQALQQLSSNLATGSVNLPAYRLKEEESEESEEKNGEVFDA